MTMSSKYNKLETTDNVDFGSNNLLESEHEQDDDIFITPDVQSNTTTKPLPKTPTLKDVEPTPVNNTTTSSEQPFFNFSSFITPQLPEFIQIETRERPFTGGNTLDESVLTTLHRDLSTIGDKLLSILWPLRLRQSLINVKQISNRISGNNEDIEDSVAASSGSSNDDEYSSETMKKIRDWDLWGPLIINLGLSLVITFLQSRSLKGENVNSSGIFSAAFTLIWSSLAVLSLNIQLLCPVQQRLENGGLTNGIIGLSFFQCISLLSYALFPILLGGLTSIFISFKFVRLVINLLMLFWSLLCTWLIIAIISNCKRRGSLTFMTNDDNDINQGDKRIFLMVYPVFLVFGLFAWFCVIV